MCNSACEEAVKYWERLEYASRSEKQWMNDRLSWLFTPQGVLFATIALTYQTNISFEEGFVDLFRQLIALLGLVISVGVLVNIIAASVMHWKWTSCMNDIADFCNKEDQYCTKVTFGVKPHLPARVSSIVPPFLALASCLVWIVIVYFYFVK